MMRSSVGGVVAGLALVANVQATGIEALHDFVRGTKSGKTSFTQTIVNKGGKVSNPASGSFSFQRPGKFRWAYEKPYEQVIVGDGQKVWIFDKDLNQVSVKRIGDALGQSPAAILAGNDDFETNFSLRDSGVRDGVEWLEAKPKGKETSFESIRIGFRKESGRSTLAMMELTDSFGQTSILVFGTFERNSPLSPDTFRFVPPKGADILGDDR